MSLARVVEWEDVGVMQSGGDLDLPEKSLRPQDPRQLGTQHLDGHPPVVLEILGEVDRGHAALAQLALKPVAVGQGRGEPVERGAHLPTSSALQMSLCGFANEMDSVPPRTSASVVDCSRPVEIH